MKNIIVFLILIFCCCIFASAQQPTPAPTTAPQPTPAPQKELPPRAVQEQYRRDQMLKIIDGTVISNANSSAAISNEAIAKIQEFYRNPKKEELARLMPEKEDLEKYSKFLRQPKTGLVRLAPDLGCANNTNVVVVNSDCSKYTMPGAGSSYSFRVKNYRIPRLADLTFINGNFKAVGVLTQGILTGIEDISLENVSLQTKGLKFLAEFEPQTDNQQLIKINDQFTRGILNEGFIYRRELKAIENITYILRSIAYRGEYYRSFQHITYNEFAFDKRKDVIIAFRIVRQSADGSITILWKELAGKESPRFKKKEVENDKTVKENKFLAKS